MPEATQQVGEALLGESSVYRLLGEKAEVVISEESLASMYHVEGRSGINPVILMMVTIFQFMEKLPDRKAAEMAVMRMDWKYALRQELTWTGFHYADLCNFRKRLLAHGQEQEVFEQVVKYLREEGYIKSGGKQRTDATHIIGKVANLSRLELLRETLKVVLGALLSHDAPWVLAHLPIWFVELYTQGRWDYRLSEKKVKEQSLLAGQHSQELLDHLEQSPSSVLQQLPELALLKRVLDEQFEGGEAGELQLRPSTECSSGVIESPHEPEAGYGNKGHTQWRGYKLQVTETANPDEAVHFITDIEATCVHESDQDALAGIQERLIERDLCPDEQYVDQGYTSGQTLQESQARGINLRGYVDRGGTHKPKGFRLTDFEIDLAQQRVICPARREAMRFKILDTPHDLAHLRAYRAWFGKQCQQCPFFAAELCTTNKRGRTLDISPYHDLLQTRRHEMHTREFQREMRIRPGIEGTISELVRAHGARRSRYRGLAKLRLQAYFIGVAANLKRLANTHASFFSARHYLFSL